MRDLQVVGWEQQAVRTGCRGCWMEVSLWNSQYLVLQGINVDEMRWDGELKMKKREKKSWTAALRRMHHRRSLYLIPTNYNQLRTTTTFILPLYSRGPAFLSLFLFRLLSLLSSLQSSSLHNSSPWQLRRSPPHLPCPSSTTAMASRKKVLLKVHLSPHHQP